MADHQLRPSRFAAGHTVGGDATNSAVAHAGLTAHPRPPVAPFQPAPTTAPQTTNRVAILAFVLAVTLGPLAAPIAVPIALVARSQCARSGQRGAGLAQASIFIGLAYLVLAAAVLALRLLVGS